MKDWLTRMFIKSISFKEEIFTVLLINLHCLLVLMGLHTGLVL